MNIIANFCGRFKKGKERCAFKVIIEPNTEQEAEFLIKTFFNGNEDVFERVLTTKQAVKKEKTS